MRISDWSSDVCSSDLSMRQLLSPPTSIHTRSSRPRVAQAGRRASRRAKARACAAPLVSAGMGTSPPELREAEHNPGHGVARNGFASAPAQAAAALHRSEEHTSELQSLMRISYAVFSLKKKNTNTRNTQRTAR